MTRFRVIEKTGSTIGICDLDNASELRPKLPRGDGKEHQSQSLAGQVPQVAAGGSASAFLASQTHKLSGVHVKRGGLWG